MKILIDIRDSVKRNEFMKSITTLASGSIVAQIVNILVSPITTRLFTPEEFGVFTIITTATGMFGPILCGRYDLNIVTEKDERKVYALIKLSTIIAFIISLIVSIGYFFYFKYFKIGYEKYLYCIVILFILLIITGLTNILTSYNNRLREYKLMTSVYVIRTIAQNVIMVILGGLKTGVFGLIASNLVGQSLGIKRQAQSYMKYHDEVKNINCDEIKVVAKKYLKQPLISSPAAFANSFSYSSINLFIENLFGASILGYYSISYRVLGLPLGIISNNVAKVFFQESSKEFNEKKNFLDTLMRTTKFLVFLAVPMVIFLMSFSPSIFKFAFGDAWRIAGEYVQILAPMFGLRFIVTGVSSAFIIVQKQDYEMLIQGILIVVSLFLYTFIKLTGGTIKLYLFLISIFYSLVYIVYYYLIYKCAIGNY